MIIKKFLNISIYEKRLLIEAFLYFLLTILITKDILLKDTLIEKLIVK